MNEIMLSIRPKWCELIASGQKTIEVRKTKPKCNVPFKVYIYCTKQRVNGEILLTYDKKIKGRNKGFRDVDDMPLAGKVIGEFVCGEILDCRDVHIDVTCLTVEEWLKYTEGHKGLIYGWHISDLTIYDKPKDLSDFGMKRSPQSWCYVEKECEGNDE